MCAPRLIDTAAALKDQARGKEMGAFTGAEKGFVFRATNLYKQENPRQKRAF